MSKLFAEENAIVTLRGGGRGGGLLVETYVRTSLAWL